MPCVYTAYIDYFNGKKGQNYAPVSSNFSLSTILSKSVIKNVTYILRNPLNNFLKLKFFIENFPSSLRATDAKGFEYVFKYT